MPNKNIFLSFCVPVYNEEQIIKINSLRITKELNKLVGKDNYEIIFVENGSTDNTIEELKKIQTPIIRFISLRKKGHGTALKSAIKNSNGTYVLLTAIDLPFGFSDLKQMVKIHQKYSLIFGSKGHPNSVIYTSASRKVSSLIYRFFLKFLFKVKIKDTQGSIFVNKKNVFPILKFCNSENAFFSSQLAIYSQREGLKMTEIPVIMNKKYLRKSKYNIIKDGNKMILSIFEEFLKIIKNKKL